MKTGSQQQQQLAKRRQNVTNDPSITADRDTCKAVVDEHYEERRRRNGLANITQLRLPLPKQAEATATAFGRGDFTFKLGIRGRPLIEFTSSSHDQNTRVESFGRGFQLGSPITSNSPPVLSRAPIPTEYYEHRCFNVIGPDGHHYLLIIRWSEEDQAYLVINPFILEDKAQHYITHGDTLLEAFVNGKEVLDLLLEEE